ncbi:MAG: nuclear transport factor 2 family protein [Sphingomonadales bacterium]|nr:nuclear transport factor 2 family protein [Sphingomonadales bacterium]
MKNYSFGFVLICISFFGIAQSAPKDVQSLDQMLDNWHAAAAQANFETYFSYTSTQFIFLGTAPGERWTKSEFMAFSKPYFDKGNAWDFKPSNRHWNFAADGQVAYFDEDLQTWMEGCRGSGICILENGQWKIAYYNLTVLIENEKIKPFIKLRQKKS